MTAHADGEQPRTDCRFVRTDRSQIEVTGDDAVAFLQGFCTNDVVKLAVGDGCEVFFCDAQGKTIGFAEVYRSDSGLEVVTAPGAATELISHLEHFVVSEDVEFTDRSGVWATIDVVGPGASSVCANVGRVTLDATPLTAAVVSAAATLRLNRNHGEYSWQFRCPAESCSQWLEKLATAGAREGDAQTLTGMRIVAGYPEFGAEVTSSRLPQELARDATAISFNKGCYLGQETVARLDAMGRVNWLLARVTRKGDEPTSDAVEFTVEDKPAGHLTSAAVLDGNIVGLAILRREAVRVDGIVSSNGCEWRVDPIADLDD
ncbi:MAG: hypothetical protein QGG36_15165 [Pirellulaceae bacterium]|jgi:folate-binding protein YgfZ|nr:hypothetical protein [Pirellulaceae bacterium]MDP7017145.1 hypothetical protein [Pirellulaceae bacterium]